MSFIETGFNFIKYVVYAIFAVLVLSIAYLYATTDNNINQPWPVGQWQQIENSDIKFAIHSDESKRDIKRTVDVVVSRKLTKTELEMFAHAIKMQSTQDYKKIFIGYYLPDTIDNGYFATSNFTPDLDISIF